MLIDHHGQTIMEMIEENKTNLEGSSWSEIIKAVATVSYIIIVMFYAKEGMNVTYHDHVNIFLNVSFQYIYDSI